MTDHEKLHEIALLLETWRFERDRLDAMVQNYPTDLVTARLISYSDHVKQLERILYP